MSFFTVVSIFERIFKKKPVHSVFSVFSGRFSVFCRNRLTLPLDPSFFHAKLYTYPMYPSDPFFFI